MQNPYDGNSVFGLHYNRLLDEGNFCFSAYGAFNPEETNTQFWDFARGVTLLLELTLRKDPKMEKWGTPPFAFSRE